MSTNIVLHSSSTAQDADDIRYAHTAMVQALLAWYDKEKRALPWRKGHAPYTVWISEMMLQQTQMERGVTYYIRWMELFPTLESVASAPIESILKAWEGLGYYQRARNLHAAARRLMDTYDGTFPSSLEELRTLPGVGEYTAGAIRSIAFNLPAPAIDANAERVFARIFDIAMPCKSKVASGFIRQIVEAIIPEGHAREFTQAIMELGALVCRKKALCEMCPVQKYCQSFRLGLVHERPVIGPATQYSALKVVTGVLVHQGRVFIQKRLETGMWAGLWEFPGGRLENDESPAEAVVRELFEETGFRTVPVDFLAEVQHSYTRYRVRLYCFLCKFEVVCPSLPVPVLEAASDYRWVRPDELDAYTFPAGHRKLLEQKLSVIIDAAKQV